MEIDLTTAERYEKRWMFAELKVLLLIGLVHISDLIQYSLVTQYIHLKSLRYLYTKQWLHTSVKDIYAFDERRVGISAANMNTAFLRHVRLPGSEWCQMVTCIAGVDHYWRSNTPHTCPPCGCCSHLHKPAKFKVARLPMNLFIFLKCGSGHWLLR
jgi:hypothetical protein